MSYSILYNSVFLKSERGITPVVLKGDNNVYDTDGHGRSVRRARDWTCFDNRLANTEEELIARVSELEDMDEIWWHHGRYVNGAGLLRWMKNGIKNAVPIEALLENNRQNHVSCYISVWGPERYEGRFCNEWISTTEAFDSWIDKAREFVATCNKDWSPFYVVKFQSEDIRALTVSRKPNDMVILKSSRGYVCSVTDNNVSWSKDIHIALEMTAAEAKVLLNTRIRWTKVQVLSANCKKSSYNSIIELRKADGKTMYVTRFTNESVYTTPNINLAHRYSTKRYANAAISKMDRILKANKMVARVIEL